MARRAMPPQKQSARLSPQAVKAALPRLEARIKEIRDLDPRTITHGDDPQIADVEARIKSTLAGIYGEDSSEYERLVPASDLDLTSYTVSFVGRGSPTPAHEIREGVERGRRRALSTLEGEVQALKERLEFDAPPVAKEAQPKEASNDVFIVHGHDSPAMTEVARLIGLAGLNAIILHEQANAGRTIIEKFEDHGGLAGFAIVLLTPDDVGGPKDGELKPRARQNVVGEMFWFAGKLGRKRVCALKKGDIEMPSDFAGIGYTDMDKSGLWRSKLLKELDAAGYNVNWGKAL